MPRVEQQKNRAVPPATAVIRGPGAVMRRCKPKCGILECVEILSIKRLVFTLEDGSTMQIDLSRQALNEIRETFGHWR